MHASTPRQYRDSIDSGTCVGNLDSCASQECMSLQQSAAVCSRPVSAKAFGFLHLSVFQLATKTRDSTAFVSHSGCSECIALPMRPCYCIRRGATSPTGYSVVLTLCDLTYNYIRATMHCAVVSTEYTTLQPKRGANSTASTGSKYRYEKRRREESDAVEIHRPRRQCTNTMASAHPPVQLTASPPPVHRQLAAPSCG